VAKRTFTLLAKVWQNLYTLLAKVWQNLYTLLAKVWQNLYTLLAKVWQNLYYKLYSVRILNQCYFFAISIRLVLALFKKVFFCHTFLKSVFLPHFF